MYSIRTAAKLGIFLISTWKLFQGLIDKMKLTENGKSGLILILCMYCTLHFD